MQFGDRPGQTIWERHCPACDAAFRVPMFTSRRRRERTCTNCGAQLELVLPGFAYYALSVLIAVVMEGLTPLLALWWLFGRNAWVLTGAGAIFVAATASSMFLNSRVSVRWTNEEKGRRAAQAAGRWYPD